MAEFVVAMPNTPSSTQLPGTVRTISYGPAADRQADLHLPRAARPAVVVLLHGGFWRMPYGRDEMTAVAEDLVSRGFAVWNMEYARLHGTESNWPATLTDVAAGIDHLEQLAHNGIDLDLARVVVVGHSAGGQLALWAAGRGRSSASPEPRVRPVAAVALAPIADLERAHDMELGKGAVAQLLGGSPPQVADRYRAASPLALLPLGVRQVIVHGTADDAVPIDLSRRYAQAAQAAGDLIELVEMEGTVHMDFLDPRSAAHATVCARLHSLVAPAR